MNVGENRARNGVTDCPESQNEDKIKNWTKMCWGGTPRATRPAGAVRPACLVNKIKGHDKPLELIGHASSVGYHLMRNCPNNNTNQGNEARGELFRLVQPRQGMMLTLSLVCFFLIIYTHQFCLTQEHIRVLSLLNLHNYFHCLR